MTWLLHTAAGTGLWPAFWMLPVDDLDWLGWGSYGVWPASGEIDIFEAKNDMMQVGRRRAVRSLRDRGALRLCARLATGQGRMRPLLPRSSWRCRRTRLS